MTEGREGDAVADAVDDDYEPVHRGGAPILRVSDMEAALTFWGAFGFCEDDRFADGAGLRLLHRDRASIGLVVDPEALPTRSYARGGSPFVADAYIFVNDLEVMLEKAKKLGVNIGSEIAEWTPEFDEFDMRTPDRHVITFARYIYLDRVERAGQGEGAQ